MATNSFLKEGSRIFVVFVGSLFTFNLPRCRCLPWQLPHFQISVVKDGQTTEDASGFASRETKNTDIVFTLPSLSFWTYIQISIHCYHCYDQLWLHEASSLNSSPNMPNLANIPPPGWLTSPFLRGTIRKKTPYFVWLAKSSAKSSKVNWLYWILIDFLKPQNQRWPKRRIEQ